MKNKSDDKPNEKRIFWSEGGYYMAKLEQGLYPNTVCQD